LDNGDEAWRAKRAYLDQVCQSKKLRSTRLLTDRRICQKKGFADVLLKKSEMKKKKNFPVLGGWQFKPVSAKGGRGVGGVGGKKVGWGVQSRLTKKDCQWVKLGFSRGRPLSWRV